MDILDTPVWEYNFSMMTLNKLHLASIHTIRELVVKTEIELIMDWKFGRRCRSEVKRELDKIGLHLGMTI